MDFNKRIQPVPRANLYTEEGYFVWCGTMFKFNDTYYMIYSRWEKSLSFRAWVTDSKVCLAKADSLEGPFHHVKELFDYRRTITPMHANGMRSISISILMAN